MRHEIIRMEHVNISRPGRHEIEDLNLIICRGYSMGVADVENSKEILADFFEGKGTLARGRIYLDGEPWKPEGKRDFEDAGIFVISKDTAYMDSLDVSENLFLLRRNSLRKIRLNEKALHIQGRALLEKYDLPYAADEHSSHLKNGDRILIGMVRAITQGARILVLREIVACFPGEERRKLRQFVNRLKQDGITVISIDNRADFTDPFFDEVILFRHHTIYKKICQNEDKTRSGGSRYRHTGSARCQRETTAKAGGFFRVGDVPGWQLAATDFDAGRGNPCGTRYTRTGGWCLVGHPSFQCHAVAV